VRANLAQARERIAGACMRSARNAADVELLAATEDVSADQLGVLVEAGLELVGENLAEDLAGKHERFGRSVTFDFIVHPQSRQTRQELPLVRLIHAVESESVLRQIERHAGGPTTVLLEVNLSGEQSKFGVAPSDVSAFLERASAYPKIRFAGLMTMPPPAENPEQARPFFSALRELGERLASEWGPEHAFRTLSMGTSQDFEVAVEEGATVVRLGGVLYA